MHTTVHTYSKTVIVEKLHKSNILKILQKKVWIMWQKRISIYTVPKADSSIDTKYALLSVTYVLLFQCLPILNFFVFNANFYLNYVNNKIIVTLFPASDSSIDTKHALLSVTHVPYPYLNFFWLFNFFSELCNGQK